jgi:hypothetical protein
MEPWHKKSQHQGEAASESRRQGEAASESRCQGAAGSESRRKGGAASMTDAMDIDKDRRVSGGGLGEGC